MIAQNRETIVVHDAEEKKATKRRTKIPFPFANDDRIEGTPEGFDPSKHLALKANRFVSDEAHKQHQSEMRTCEAEAIQKQIADDKARRTEQTKKNFEADAAKIRDEITRLADDMRYVGYGDAEILALFGTIHPLALLDEAKVKTVKI